MSNGAKKASAPTCLGPVFLHLHPSPARRRPRPCDGLGPDIRCRHRPCGPAPFLSWRLPCCGRLSVSRSFL
jgi:hypothetical protein